MKISILLPYKENFSPEYAGAVSLFVNDTVALSKYKKNISIYGSTSFKKKFNLKYKNIPLNKSKFRYKSLSREYVDEFIRAEIQNESDIIEIHNRPNYLRYLVNDLPKKIYIIYFHNDPLSMLGSKTIEDRKFLLKNCYKILFNSNWSKQRFLQGMQGKFINSEKLQVVYQSTKKQKINFSQKKKWITLISLIILLKKILPKYVLLCRN